VTCATEDLRQNVNQIKYPKPNRFHGDPRSFQPWITDVELYFNSYTLTGNNKRIWYTLALLSGAASDWKKDFITKKPGTLGTWREFRDTLDQSFQPIQHAEESHRRLMALKQRGTYINKYITAFSVLASEAGLTNDGAPLCQYFKNGLDPDVKIEAIRTNPKTIREWKTAARNTYSIIRELRETRNTHCQPYCGNKKDKNCNQRRFNPRYEDISRQPVLS
jgi:hypothetical protein